MDYNTKNTPESMKIFFFSLFSHFFFEKYLVCGFLPLYLCVISLKII